MATYTVSKNTGFFAIIDDIEVVVPDNIPLEEHEEWIKDNFHKFYRWQDIYRYLYEEFDGECGCHPVDWTITADLVEDETNNA